mgnify:FL=1
MITRRPLAMICMNDPMERDLTRLVLQRSGFQCEVIESALDLVNTVIRSHPIILILDVVLPGMNGLDAVMNIKKDMQSSAPAIAVISSLTFPEIVSKAQKAGVDEFVAKPLDADQLRARLNKMVNKTLSAGVKNPE